MSDLTRALIGAERSGTLPLTSTCNLSCLFCSNHFTPPGLRVLTLPPRSPSDVDRALARMSHLEEVVVGESASRVTEGEPLTHPRFLEIMALVRRRLPLALIKITTNGSLLNVELARALADLGPVEVTVSVNTLSAGASRRLHGREVDAAAAACSLAAAGIPYHGSIVALPAVSGPEDIIFTAQKLEEWGCLSCRVFAPGHTYLTPPDVVALMPTREEVHRMVSRARAQTQMPLTLEPPDIPNLAAEIAGVMRDTPAVRAGLRAGDVVLRVENATPLSRVDAFNRSLRALRRTGRCRLEVAGRGEIVLEADRADASPRPGFIMDRDVDPRDLRMVARAAGQSAAGRVLVLTSELGAPVLGLALAGGSSGERRTGPGSYTVHPVRSTVFGGSVACAGLLTVTDFEAALLDLSRCGRAPGPGEVVLLPPMAFDSAGVDLSGRRATELCELLPAGVRLMAPGSPRE